MAKKEVKVEPEVEETDDTGVMQEKSLGEVAGVGGKSFVGDGLTMAQVEGKPITVEDFRLLDSTFHEGKKYVCLQIRLKGKQYVLNCNATVIVKAFVEERITAEHLPAKTTFSKVTGKNGKEYWTMA